MNPIENSQHGLGQLGQYRKSRCWRDGEYRLTCSLRHCSTQATEPERNLECHNRMVKPQIRKNEDRREHHQPFCFIPEQYGGDNRNQGQRPQKGRRCRIHRPAPYITFWQRCCPQHSPINQLMQMPCIGQPRCGILQKFSAVNCEYRLSYRITHHQQRKPR